jgi:hypothetical protein
MYVAITEAVYRNEVARVEISEEVAAIPLLKEYYIPEGM